MSSNRPRQVRQMPHGTTRYDLLLDPEHQRLVQQVEDIADKTAQTAVVLERLTNFWQDNDRRLTALENGRPTFASVREWWALGISLAVLAFYLVSFVGQHWK